MKKFIKYFCLLSLFLFCNLDVNAISDDLSVPKGTVIPLAYSIKVNSRNVKPDDQIPVYVVKDVLVNGRVVFNKGAKGYLTVFDARKVNAWSWTEYKKGGFIEFDGGEVADAKGIMRKIDYNEYLKGADLNPSSSTVYVGNSYINGTNQNVSTVGTAFSNGYSITGENVIIPKDTRFRVKTSEDFIINY